MELNIYIYLAISIAIALASGKLMKLLRLPNVTGYIIFGLIAGPSVLNIIPGDIVDRLSFIPEVALGFIAFSIGSEFKLSYLKKVGKSPIVIAFTESAGAVLVVDLILIAVGQDVPFSISLGAIAAATAPAATLMVVKQYKAKGPVTDTLLPVVAIDDATALMCFGVSVAIARALESTGEVSVAQTILSPLLEIGGALLFGSVCGIAFRFLIKLFTGRGNRLAITYALVFLNIGMANMLGFSPLLACMALGAILANTSNECDMIFEQTDRMTPPIFMMFFFLSGAGLDLSVLPSVGLIGLIYIFGRMLGKVLGALFGAKVSHAAPVVQKYLGYTLIPQAGVAIGLATTAMSVVPEHGPQIRTIILCGTIIYELTGPVITKLALKKAGEIGELPGKR